MGAGGSCASAAATPYPMLLDTSSACATLLEVYLKRINELADRPGGCARSAYRSAAGGGARYPPSQWSDRQRSIIPDRLRPALPFGGRFHEAARARRIRRSPCDNAVMQMRRWLDFGRRSWCPSCHRPGWPAAAGDAGRRRQDIRDSRMSAARRNSWALRGQGAHRNHPAMRWYRRRLDRPRAVAEVRRLRLGHSVRSPGFSPSRKTVITSAGTHGAAGERPPAASSADLEQWRRPASRATMPVSSTPVDAERIAALVMSTLRLRRPRYRHCRASRRDACYCLNHVENRRQR